MIEDLWTGKSTYITSFWGWSPETWGNVGFTSSGRRETIVREATDPFIVVVYVTKNAPLADADLRGKVAGFYFVSHTRGHRNEFTHGGHHKRNPEKWQYSLKAVRAFSFLPEYRLTIDEFDPSLGLRARAVAAYGEPLSDDQVKRLQRVPFIEVPVFGGPSSVFGEIQVPKVAKKGAQKVKAGPANRSGYIVLGEPVDTEKELYSLVLKGDTSAFLGEKVQGCRIFKIGLSLSPKTRLETFCKSLPQGAFTWELHRSTRKDGYEPYSSFEAAEAGESAMKDFLGHPDNGRWLGGEFYCVTDKVLEHAWKIGREAALSYRRKR